MTSRVKDVGLVLVGRHKAHGAGAAVVRLAVDGGELDVRHQGVGDGQRDDADGDAHHRDERLQAVLHQVARGHFEVVKDDVHSVLTDRCVCVSEGKSRGRGPNGQAFPRRYGRIV